MTNKNLKDLVEEIKKVAAPPPPKKPGYVPSGKPSGGGGTAGPRTLPGHGGPGAGGGRRVLPGHGGKPVGGGRGVGGGGYVAPQEIKKMQTAIQNVAKTISATIDYSALQKTMQGGPPAPNAPPDEEGKRNFQAQYGKDMFSNFMVNNYLKRANVKGVEYDTDPKRAKMLEKKPSDLKSMFVILDTLQRVGSESAESFADGNWGPRTNNALKNVSAIAEALVKLGGELGMESQSFDTKKIAELEGLIPPSDTSINTKDKVARAPKIEEILNGVRALFLDFKQQVFMDPTYRNFIEGKTSIMDFGPAKEKGVDASEGEKTVLADLQEKGSKSRFANHQAAMFWVSIPKEYMPTQFQQKYTENTKWGITAGDLVSPQAFDQWVAGSDVMSAIKQQNPASWPAVVQSVLSQVDKLVDQKLAGTKQVA